MKSKLVLAGFLALSAFVTIALLLEHFEGGRNEAARSNQITMTADGKVLVRPPSLPKMTVVAHASVLSNAPSMGR